MAVKDVKTGSDTLLLYDPNSPTAWIETDTYGQLENAR